MGGRDGGWGMEEREEVRSGDGRGRVGLVYEKRWEGWGKR